MLLCTRLLRFAFLHQKDPGNGRWMNDSLISNSIQAGRGRHQCRHGCFLPTPTQQWRPRDRGCGQYTPGDCGQLNGYRSCRPDYKEQSCKPACQAAKLPLFALLLHFCFDRDCRNFGGRSWKLIHRVLSVARMKKGPFAAG